MAQSFLSAIKSNPSLGFATRLLSLKIRIPPITEENYSHITHHTTHAITSQCPGLYRLNLQIPSHSNTKLLHTVIHPHIFETLRALDVSVEEVWVRDDTTNLRDFFQFINSFRSLSHLRLLDIRWFERPDLSLTVPPSPPFQLEEFVWRNNLPPDYESNVNTFNLIVEWLFGKSSSHLRVFEYLDLRSATSEEDFSSFILTHGRNLISIRTHFSSHALCMMSLDLPQLCPDLREIILPRVWTLTPALQSTLSLPNLEHLWLGGMVGDVKWVTESMFWIRSLPRLQRLTMGDLGNRFHWQKHWEQLPLSNITVEWMVSGHRMEERILPVEFPEGMTIGNFGRISIA
ncbi:hypothetical protein FRC03_002615 [Tulasnella sp. 419]|nr:hypothetical protein FRC03_002615 [Tulasnella sp. 419]